jgi:hypothetical protein
MMLVIAMVNTCPFKGPGVGTQMVKVSLVVCVVGCSRGGTAEVLVVVLPTSLEGRLLGVTFLEVGEIFIIDGG